jgi:hypothetical protein
MAELLHYLRACPVQQRFGPVLGIGRPLGELHSMLKRNPPGLVEDAIHKLAILLHNQGRSLQQISQELNDGHYPTQRG